MGISIVPVRGRAPLVIEAPVTAVPVHVPPRVQHNVLHLPPAERVFVTALPVARQQGPLGETP